MEETNYRPIAVLGVPGKPVHVPDGIITLYATLEKLGNSGDHIIDAPVLTAQIENVDTLQEKQLAMTGGAPDKTEQRNTAYSVCFLEHQANMMQVQIKSNTITDPEQAAALIKRNGYEMAKSHSTPLAAAIQIKTKPGFSGTILASVKAPDTTQQFAIEWAYSYDNGENWINLFATGVCDREIPNLTLKNAVMVRARFIIGYENPKDWIVSNSINI